MKFRVLTLLFAGALVVPAAHAVVAFNNFGPNGEFQTGTGATVGGTAGPIGYISQGNGFVAGASGQITNLVLGYGHVAGTNTSTFNLHEDAAGSVGAFMASWNVTNSPAFGSGLTIGIGNVNPAATLVQGNSYWLLAESASDALQAWNFNSIGDVGPYANRTNPNNPYSTSTGDRMALKVEVVPEPISMLVLGAGLAGLALRRKKA